MRAALYYGPGDVRISDIPEPEVKKGQIKIKIAWNGICGSDLHAYLDPLPVSVTPTATSPHYITKETLPIGLGHEFSGSIVELGQDVDTSKYAVGQNVIVEPVISCMESSCVPCSVGSRNVCSHTSFIGLSGWGGGLAEYVSVDQKLVHIVPDGVPLEIAAMIEPLSVAWHAVKRSSFTRGDSALVLGAGPIGLLQLMVLRALGASWVGISEPAVGRREAATQHLASAVLDPFSVDVVAETLKATNGQGVDVVFDCAGTQATLETALSAVRSRGSVVSVAVWEKPATVNINLVMFKEIIFTGIMAYDRVHAEVVQAVAEGKFAGLESLITRKISLEDVVEKGIKALLHEKDTQIKILVHP